jgi:hypothetical protein
MNEYHEARLAISIDRGGRGLTHIEVQDRNSLVHTVEIVMKNEDFVKALACRADTPAEVKYSDKIQFAGMYRETKDFKVHLGLDKDILFADQVGVAKREAVNQCPQGWYVQLYFGRRSSFETKAGVLFANTVIYRYVKEEPK